MSSIAVSQGQAVTQGQVIGYVGSTGNSPATTATLRCPITVRCSAPIRCSRVCDFRRNYGAWSTYLVLFHKNFAIAGDRPFQLAQNVV
ncbi:M23 family metallopeptidase [Gemmiger formicilis]|uniref:M23 family metallopeptidase n=1 Tax=Gemmiger formicilis TaxID=745368 RepID=UPI0035221B44